jgi:hypothetical protein
VLFRRPVQPLPDGGYRLRLRAEEREAVGRVVEELRAAVVERDPAAARLFPPAHRDDPVAAAEFEELVRESLESERLEALATVRRTLDAERLAEEEAAAWCGVLNDARLVLGERLGVTEELYESGISARDPRAAELAYYGWLTWLQGELVEALASRL